VTLNGAILAVGDDNDSTYVWSVARQRVIDTFADPAGGVTSGVNAVAFGPGGKILATGDDDGSTYLWPVPRPDR
jgi:WD40 repeat protein